MAFPTSPSDGDEYTNILGTKYKYLAVDDKWYIISTALNIVDDISPQLGGDLDLNGKNIDFPTTPNIGDVIDDDDFSSATATSLATSESIKAFVDAYLGIGSGNEKEQNLQQCNVDANVTYSFGNISWRNAGATDYIISFDCPLPPTLGALKLYLTDILVWTYDADDGDEVDRIRLFGWSAHATVDLLKDTNAGLNLQTVKEWSWDSEIGLGGPLDVSTYERLVLLVNVTSTTASEFEISRVFVKYYYDT